MHRKKEKREKKERKKNFEIRKLQYIVGTSMLIYSCHEVRPYQI